jgi:hypothetical protein
MEDNLNFYFRQTRWIMEDDLNNFLIEDNLNFILKMEDDLNFF